MLGGLEMLDFISDMRYVDEEGVEYPIKVNQFTLSMGSSADLDMRYESWMTCLLDMVTRRVVFKSGESYYIGKIQAMDISVVEREHTGGFSWDTRIGCSRDTEPKVDKIARLRLRSLHPTSSETATPMLEVVHKPNPFEGMLISRILESEV